MEKLGRCCHRAQLLASAPRKFTLSSPSRRDLSLVRPSPISCVHTQTTTVTSHRKTPAMTHEHTRRFGHSTRQSLPERDQSRRLPPSTATGRTNTTTSTLPPSSGIPAQDFQGPSYETCRYVCYSLVGLFVAICGGHAYITSGPASEKMSETPVMLSVEEYTNRFKRHPVPSRNQIPSLQELLQTKMLAYRVVDWPPDLTNWRTEFPFFASMFSHTNPIHLLVNSQALLNIAPAVMLCYGAGTGVFAFMLSGLLGSAIHSTVERAYAYGTHPKMFVLLKRSSKDPHPQRTLYAYNIGASGAICGLLAIFELTKPRRMPTTFTMIFTAGSAALWWADPQGIPVLSQISHGGHLAGLLSGVLIWGTWLRWTKAGRYWAMQRRLGG